MGHQWKMQFNPDKTKQAVQVIFSQERDKLNYPLVYFNESEVIVKPKQNTFRDDTRLMSKFP